MGRGVSLSGKTVSGIMLILIVTNVLMLAFFIRPVKAATIIVPDQYATIQAAINAARAGDTIQVRAGTYSENIVVDKRLSLQGAGWWTTVVRAVNPYEAVFSIFADYVAVTGFTVRDANGSNSSMLGYGMLISGSYANIFENCFENNYNGIVLSGSSNSIISRNRILNNQECGIYSQIGSKNVVSFNDVSGNQGDGIDFSFFSNLNVISNNNVTSNYGGIMLSGYDPEYYPVNNFNNTISFNTVSLNVYGINIQPGCNNSFITSNILLKNEIYVLLIYCSDFIYTYHNNFIENLPWRVLLFESNNDRWDDGYPSGGNYWSDYTGTDADADGIGDTPYVIDANNTDRYPLMNPWTPTPPAPGFSIMVSPVSLAIQQGSSDTSTITIASANGFNQVQLTVSEAPSGVTTTLNPQQVTPPADGSTTSTLTVSVGTTATVGSYTLTITGISGALTHSTQISLEVTAAPQNEWTFAIITDLHIGRGYLNYNGEDYYLTDRLNDTVKWIADNSQAKKIRFVAVLGDLTEDGTPSEMSKVKDILDVLNSKGIPYFPVIGNHDIKAEGDHVFQDKFTDSFFETQCTMLGADVQWINGRVYKLTSVIQNYAFDYENKRFIFLDWVDRNGFVADAKPYDETQTFLTDKLAASVDPVFLFSHHPMVWEPPLPCFSYTDIQTIGNIIRNSNAQVLGSFAGHIHGYYDSDFLNLTGAYWVPNQDDPLPNPNFESGNIDYTSGNAVTPAGISVLGTEALMSASIDPYHSVTLGCRNVTRIVEMMQGNTFETYVDHESLALNPYIIRAETPPGKVGLHQNGVDFLVYAFTRMFDATHPVNYSLYVDGVLRDSKNSSQVERIWFRDQKLTHGTHEANLTVVGYAPDGHRVVESIKRSFDVGRFLVALKCPADIIVTDPAGRTISKQVNEIPDATYTEVDLDENGDLDKLVEILAPIDGNYVITLNGTDPGLYSMIAQFATSQEVVSFNATEIPVSFGAVHQYIINWAALSLGEEGVTVNIDSNGDRIFEYNFASDSELNRIEYVAATTQHDLGITGITSSKSVTGEGYSLPINITTMNYGVYTETFNVTFYVNTTLVASQTVTLASGNSTTVTFAWNTTGFAKGNYTITTYAEPVPNETYIVDNNVTCIAPVHVGVPGDVSGTNPGVYDGITNMKDIAYLVSLFNTKPSSPNWMPNADVNNDGIVNMKDIAIAVYYFNQHE